MRKRPWLALAASAGLLAAFVPIEAPGQPAPKPRPAETMNQRVARESRLTEEQIVRVLNVLGPAMRDELKKGNSVSLPGLGTFRVVRVAEHKDMEAGTGRVLRVPARNTVEFLATDGLNEVANSPSAVPAETVPAFEYTPLPNQIKGQKVPPTKTEGT
ncbi:MAG TPA: HU family DNA-binding protein, partial [Gemmataceae bacterium]|nr:HU family DNA-binding protein [Gemmataceae bacterium]